MGERHSFYIGDEDDHINNWIDEVADDAFGSKSQFVKKCIEFTKQERQEEIESLATDDNDNTVL